MGVLVIQLVEKSNLSLGPTWHFVWLCSLVLSFAHELPLAYLTPFDRTNPRLFDVLSLIGVVVLCSKETRTGKFPRPFSLWSALIIWFCFCAIIWAIFLPPNYGNIAVFRALKYVQGLIVVFIALQIPIDEKRKKVLQSMMVFGGLYIATFCVFQYVRGDTLIQVRDGLFVDVGLRNLTGPFGASYFQLAQTSSLFFIFSLFQSLQAKSLPMRFVYLAASCFISWPLFASGSRTGLGLFVVSLLVAIVVERRLRRTVLALGIVLIGFILIGFGHWVELLMSGNTLQRAVNMRDGSANGLANRLLAVIHFPLSTYAAGALVLAIGGGFYVAPVVINGVDLYRIDYGLHSFYLFPLEQGGVLAFTLFIYFIISSFRHLQISRNTRNSTDRNFANATFAYFVATLVAGIGGHNFWQGFGSGNVNTLILLIVMLALNPSRKINPEVIDKKGNI